MRFERSTDGRGEERLHPTSLLFTLASDAKRLLIPALLVVVFSRGSNWNVWLAALFVPSALYGVLRYVSVRYSLASDELVLREGILFRNERHIPFARIQNIDLIQNPLHRLWGVAEVRLETAGGSDPEAVLRVLSLEAVETMRDRIFGGATSPAARSSTAERGDVEVLVRLGLGELLKLGCIAHRVVAIVAAAAFAVYEFGLHKYFDRLEPLTALLFEASTSTVILTLLSGGVATLVILLGLSMLGAVLRCYDFTLSRTGDDLRLNGGLLTRFSATVPRPRIQFISIRETPLHRLFGRVSVRIETAGSFDDNEEGAASRRWFVPLLPRSEYPALVKKVFPAVSLHAALWQPLTARARRRLMRRRLIVAAVVTVASGVLMPPWGALTGVLALPLAAWHARREARYMSHARTASAVLFRSGAWTRKLSATLIEKIQVVRLSQSPFDRRLHMASLAVDTAGAGVAGHAVNIPYLDDGVARELQRDLVGCAETGG